MRHFTEQNLNFKYDHKSLHDALKVTMGSFALAGHAPPPRHTHVL